jgi:hypothetical protein
VLLNFVLLDAGKAAVVDDAAFISLLQELFTSGALMKPLPSWHRTLTATLFELNLDCKLARCSLCGSVVVAR